MGSKKWIVFEGLDGSGKTTQALLLKGYMDDNGIKSCYKHVFDTKIGREMRRIFLENNKLHNTSEILLLSVARQEYMVWLRRRIEEFDVIITDRFFDSIASMQGYNKQYMEMIVYLKNRIMGTIQPVIIFIDTSPSVCAERLLHKNRRDRIEYKGIGFQDAVYRRYVSFLKKQKNVIWVDGNRDVLSVHADIAKKAVLLLNSI